MKPPLRLAAVLAAAAIPSVAAAATCSAVSPPTATPLVELYTSEGCSSCPPADRWLSALKRRDDVVALAWHVHYWDHLGWRDRFGSAAHTTRQATQRAVNGARVSYTPQVVIDGRDRPDWPRAALSTPSRARAALVRIRLERDGARIVAHVDALEGAPALLSGLWVATEDDHVSAVRAGENDGETLRHDFVVRDFRDVAPWQARPGQAQRLEFTPAGAADPQHPRRVALVVLDSAGRPLQALQLAACG